MPKRQKYQHGVALFVVIVIVMLSMLLALWASRTSWFGEMLVGNDADYQRAFEAAQAMIQDAELDIRGEQSTEILANLLRTTAIFAGQAIPSGLSTKKKIWVTSSTRLMHKQPNVSRVSAKNAVTNRTSGKTPLPWPR